MREDEMRIPFSLCVFSEARFGVAFAAAWTGNQSERSKSWGQNQRSDERQGM
jgi:hypothetical protein